MPRPRLSEPRGKRSDMRLADAEAFRALYEKLRDSPPGSFGTCKDLFLKVGEERKWPVTSIVNRLAHLASFCFGGTTSPKNQGPGFDLLFQRLPRDGGIQATQAADALYNRVCVLRDFFHETHAEVRDAAHPKNRLPIVRIGVPHVIGMNLLWRMLSRWRELFAGCRLEVEIENTEYLIPRLNAGLLDCVIAYGPVDRRQLPADPTKILEPGLEVCFRSLGYRSRMVLLCHPALPLHARLGDDVNAGYWRRSYRGKSEPHYDRLRPIRLEDIDYSQTQLILSRSWRQPQALRDFVDRVQPRVDVRLVKSYAEALALVRMAMGVAPASETLCKSSHITAFRIEPAESFTRWIGVYYSARFGVSPQTALLLKVAEKYLKDFEPQVRKLGRPPAYGDREYDNWCKQFQIKHDWEAWAAEADGIYPRLPIGKSDSGGKASAIEPPR